MQKLENWDPTKRDAPFKFLRMAIDELRRRNGKVIVEIGCMRQRFNHPIEVEPDTCPSRCDGHSTVHFASTGLEFFSVDVDKKALDLAAEYTKGRPKTHIVNKDGIAFLKQFGHQIDLLFLDAWDVDRSDCAEKHLEAYNVIKKRLPPRALLMIDDCDVDMIDGKLQPAILNYGGKGELVVPQALNEGWKVMAKGRCVVLSKI
jgi:hypothetical protein